VYDPVCIFCNGDKYLDDTTAREPLVQCKELRADKSIREAATRKMDGRVLALVSRDLVAAEGHYHRSCYRDYTRTKKKSDSSVNMGNIDSDNSADMQCESAMQSAKEELFPFIRNELLLKPDVVPMTQLTSIFINNLANHGVTEVKASSKKHLRRVLEAEFKDTLLFVNDKNGRLLVYPSSLAIDTLVLKYHAVREELGILKSKTDKSAILKAALNLRQVITSQDTGYEWPPTTTRACIADALAVFFYTLLTGENECSSPPERVQRLTSSLGQDIVYAVTNGKVKPPKHILLPYAVKSLTGNVELIHTLNRFGHGVSSSVLQEIDTAICLQKLSLESEISLPLELHPGVFTTLAWDNIDRLEETLSGGGTSHRVNGIAIQQKEGYNPEPQVLPNVPKTKQRSISFETGLIPIYNAGKRVGPKQIETVDPDASTVVHNTFVKNIAWVMSRLSSEEQAQTVSGWTGFNIKIRSDIEVVQDNVAYLPTINAPATDLSTVYEILNGSLKIMHALDLTVIVCVFDQALYAKALEVAWKNEELFSPVIIRMGVFHTICTMLAIVGKRFADAGLRDLSVESGVIAEGSVSGVLDGCKYNLAIRLHKLMYEAIMRLICLPRLQNLSA